MAPHSRTTRETHPRKSDVYILLDRSSSMAVRWTEALSAINGYVSGLAQSRTDLRITLVLFDQPYPPMPAQDEGRWFHVLRERVPAGRWRPITPVDAHPRGATPLYDAVERLVALADESDATQGVVVVMTDGEENCSRTATKASAKAALDHCREKGWQVAFLGADFDNSGQAASLGGAASQTMALSAGSYSASMDALASSTLAHAEHGEAMSFERR